MALITWTAHQFGTNVPIADEEHKILYDKLNKLYDLATSGAPRSTIGVELDDLIAYVVDHFAHEEIEIQAKSHERNKAEHDALIAVCADLQTNFYAAYVNVTDDKDVGQIVKGWLDDFPHNFDKAYADALKITGTTDPGPSLKHS